MREIKFRAWERNMKEMITVTDIDFEKACINANSAWRKFDEIYLMQYIGLKDKNGVEIYEHDTCHIVDGWGNEWTTSVAWGNINGDNPEYYPAFDLDPQVDEELNSIASIYESGDFTIEVIGNIYEGVK